MKSINVILISIILFIIAASATAQTKEVKKTTSKAIKQQRDLVYLYAANGGMVIYFSDGSAVDCPKCDFCRSTILGMFKKNLWKNET